MWDFICGVPLWLVTNLVIGPLVSTMIAIGDIIDPGNHERKMADEAAKAVLTKPGYHIIGLQTGTARLITKPSSFTQTKFDTTSYPDRAVITITNATAGAVVCTGISIQGKAVIQRDAAYQWSYKDYTAIERDGEKGIEVSNSYIISADHTAALGDYIKKELSAHSMYKLIIPGCAYHYTIGDKWHLTLSYMVNGQASEAENIDVDVEVTSVMFSRKVGGIGETVLEVRVPSGTWSKTTSRRAKLISSGRPQDLLNRGNVIRVGASDYTGQADYYCDGTADDVQIQAAIDYATSVGGIVYLTEGSFILAATLTMKNNVVLMGQGPQTMLKPASTSVPTMITFVGSTNARIESFSVDGLKASLNFTSAGMLIITGGVPTTTLASALNIFIQNYKFTADADKSATCFYGLKEIISCTVSTCDVIVAAAMSCTFNGFASVLNVLNCMFFNNTVASSGANGTLFGINGATRVTNFECTGNAATGTAGGVYGVFANNVTNSVVSGNTTTGTGGVTGFFTCGFISNCLFTANGTIAASAFASTFGFNDCDNITNCYSHSNTTPGAGAIDYGFNACTQVQQCKSLDATKYTNSYADVATNACANTAAGGYNA